MLRASALYLVWTVSLGTSFAQTATWTGAVDGQWDTSTLNWDDGGAAAFVNGDDVIFGATGVGTVTIAGSVDPGSVTINADTYTIAGGTLNNPGTITVTNAGDTATISATIAGSDPLNINGAGTLSLSGANTATGFMLIDGPTTVNLFGSLANQVTLNNGGAVLNLQAGSSVSTTQNLSVSSGTLNVDGNATTGFIGNGATGTVAIDAGVALNNVGGFSTAGTFTVGNGGSLNGGGIITGGTFSLGTSTDLTTQLNGNVTVSGNTAFTNHGTITGTVDFDGLTAGATITNSGVMTGGGGPGGNLILVNSGVTMDNSGTLNGSVTNNGGIINLAAGTMQSGGNFSNTSGALNVDGNATTGFISNGATGTVAIDAGVALNNVGGFSSTGTFTVGNGGSLNGGGIITGGTFSLGTSTDLTTQLNGNVTVSGNTVFTNHGTITGTVDFDGLTAGATITNSGVMAGGGGPGGNLILVNSGVMMDNSGTLNGSVTNNGGIINLAAGTMQSGGNFSNTSGTLNVDGNATTGFISNGATGTVAIDAGVALNNVGGFSTAGTFTVGNGGSLNGGGIITGGTFSLGTSTDLTTQLNGNVTVSGNTAFTNHGTITGTVTANAGSTGSIINSGAMSLTGATGATIANTGNLTIAGNLTGTNTFTNSTGGTTTVGAGATLTASTLDNEGTGVGANAATLTVATGGTANVTDLNNKAFGVINVAGVVTTSTVITNATNGLINVTTGQIDGVLTNVGGTINMQNGSTQSGGNFSNTSGMVTVSGTVATGGGVFNYANSGTTIVNSGASWTSTGGFSQVNGTFTNNGTMTGSMNLTGGTFNNNDTLTGTVNLLSTNTGDLVNSGTITSNVTTAAGATGTITNTGTISGNTAPLIVQTGQTLNNSGTIAQQVTNLGMMNLQNGAMMTNAANVSNSGTGVTTIGDMGGAAATINIAGLFANTSSVANAVMIFSGANVTATAGFSQANGTFTNNGTMNGSMNLGGGIFNNGNQFNGPLTLLSGAGNLNNGGTIDGTITMNSGASGMVVNSGIVTGDIITNAGATNTIVNSGLFQGTGLLTVQSGQVFNNSGTVSGAVTNLGMTNLMNGTTQSGGTFTNTMGTVAVDGNAVQTAAFVNQAVLDLSDGATGDTLTVNGDFTLSAGGTLQLDVDPVANLGDLIQVTGTASVGGMIDVNLLSNGAAASVDILTATVGVTDAGATLGTVTGVANPIFSADLDFSDPNALALSLTINAVLGNFNANQMAIVDNINAGGSTDALTALLGLPTISATAAALDQLSPEIYLDTQTSLAYAAEETLDSLYSCDVIDPGGASVFAQQGNCLWFRPHGRYSSYDRTGAVIGFDERAFGASAGGQWAVGQMLFLGASAGYEYATIDNNAGASSDSARYQIGASLKYIDGPMFLGGAIAGGLGEFDTSRTHLLGRNTGESDHSYFGARVRAAYSFEQGGYYATPSIDLEAVHVRVDGFTETGTPATALTVPGFDDTFVTLTPAIEVGTEWVTEEQTSMRAYGGVGGRFQLDGTSGLSANFVGAGAGVGNFGISTQRDDFVLDLAAGIKAQSQNGSTLGIEYDGKIGSRTNSHGAFLKGSIKF